MTTAHKPTLHAAVAKATQGNFRYYAPRAQFSARDIAHHTKLKVRQSGQNAPNEIAARDLKYELEERERQHKMKALMEKKKEGLLPYAETDTAGLLESGEVQLDMKSVDLSKFDDADDDVSEGDDDKDDDNEDDDEAELLRELERLKKEKEEEKLKKQQEEESKKTRSEEEAILAGNPLLNKQTFAVKRRWDEDVVFRNQAKDERKPKKRFINDTTRSDFHRNFLTKYMK